MTLVIEETKDRAEPIVVFGLCFEAEAIIPPSLVSGHKVCSEPAAKKLLPGFPAPTPDVAALMQPAVRFDNPLRRPLDGFGVVNRGPVHEARVIESLIEEETFSASEAEQN
jgi:hypothetical protein